MTQDVPTSTLDLSGTERRFVVAMSQLWFGRFESVPIRCGELVLAPWPTTVRDIKFATPPVQSSRGPEHFPLKRQVVELFSYIRRVQRGMVRKIEIQAGLPYSMQVEDFGGPREGAGDE